LLGAGLVEKEVAMKFRPVALELVIAKEVDAGSKVKSSSDGVTV